MTKIISIVTKKVFVVPARGGSKSIPKKNIALLNNRPLIYYTLTSLYRVNDISNSLVICSTDCDEIASIAKSIYPGIIIHKRLPKFASDECTMHSSILNLVSEVTLPDEFDLCILQPTSPLRTSEDINNAFVTYYNMNSKSLFSVSLVSHTSSPEKIMTSNDHGQLVFSNNLLKMKQRQEIHKVYYARNSALYLIHSSKLNDGLIFDCSHYYTMPSYRSIDIDTFDDLFHASLLLKGLEDTSIRLE